MRKILSLLFTFFYLNLTAQEKISEQQVGWKGGGLQLYTISNTTFSCSFILALDSIRAIILDSSSKTVQQFTIHRRGPTEKFLGAFIKNGSVYLYMDNAKNPGLHTWRLSVNDNTVKETILPFKIKKNKVLTQLSSNNHFIYFTVNKHASEFVIYDFEDERHFDTTHYRTETGIFKDISQDVISLSPVFNTSVVSIEGECDIDIAKNLNKIYMQNDNLVLVCNASNAVTDIYEFDLNNKKMAYRQVKHDPENLYGRNGHSNSFLLDDRLYYTSATGNALMVQVVDFNSGKILKTFKAAPDEEIDFKNTSITLEGSYFGVERELGKTRQLLRKMINGNAVIAAYPDISGKLVQVLVGSHTEIARSTMAGSYSGNWTSEKTAMFKMLIDFDTHEHIAGEMPLSINDSIKIYNKEIKIPGKGENLLRRNGHYSYYYYDKEKRSLNIVKF